MALLMGMVLGFLTGLGVGGGSLLILWLTLGLGMNQEIATGINLLFFLPSALVSCCFRYRQGAVDLKKLFGVLLLVTGVREVFYKGR